MARKQKLKVYRTPIGFHDAYVAASSQKEALRAWGADVDLFARGVAEAVTDEELMREPLEKPGTVVRRARGTSEEHVAALPKDRPRRKRRTRDLDEEDGPPQRRRTRTGKPRSARRTDRPPERNAPANSELEPKPTPKRRTGPRPSRDKLDEAERAIERTESDHAKRIADIREEEKRLQQERRELDVRHEAEIAKLETTRDKIRDRYTVALQKWRD